MPRKRKHAGSSLFSYRNNLELLTTSVYIDGVLHTFQPHPIRNNAGDRVIRMRCSIGSANHPLIRDFVIQMNVDGALANLNLFKLRVHRFLVNHFNNVYLIDI